MMTGTWSGSSCWDVGCITDTTLSSEQKCKVRGIWWGERVCVYLCSDAPACVYQRLSDWVQQQLWQTSRAQLHWYTTHMKACTRDLVSPVATANPGDALLKHSIGVCIVCIHLLSFKKKKTLLRIFFYTFSLLFLLNLIKEFFKRSGWKWLFWWEQISFDHDWHQKCCRFLLLSLFSTLKDIPSFQSQQWSPRAWLFKRIALFWGDFKAAEIQHLD